MTVHHKQQTPRRFQKERDQNRALERASLFRSLQADSRWGWIPKVFAHENEQWTKGSVSCWEVFVVDWDKHVRAKDEASSRTPEKEMRRTGFPGFAVLRSAVFTIPLSGGCRSNWMVLSGGRGLSAWWCCPGAVSESENTGV